MSAEQAHIHERSFSCPNVPDVLLPGQLDADIVRNWGRRLAETCRGALCENLGAQISITKSSGNIVAGAEAWQRPSEADLFAFALNENECCIIVPSMMAKIVVAKLLGFDTLSDAALGTVDFGILAMWLQPVADGIAALAALAASRVHWLEGPAPYKQAAEPFVVLDITMSDGRQTYVFLIVLPWEAVRDAVRCAANNSGRTISVEKLSEVSVRADAYIDGGTMGIQEFMGLEIGDLVMLERDDSETVELRVNGRRVLKGSIGSHASNWALRVGNGSDTKIVTKMIGG